MDRVRTVRIDQALHGYDRGHRELASSVALDEPSRAAMLVLSDLVAATGLHAGSSYLTAYPLKSASKFVLARTWSAGKGYRPGSVWTHSLILDYQALALIPDLLSLRMLFCHPDGSKASFSQYLTFAVGKHSDISVHFGGRAMDALLQLYGDTPEREIVLPSADAEADEVLALALWRQMWPALRRDFAFFTSPSDGPASLHAGCSLRFSNSSNTISPHLGSFCFGYEALLNDLPNPGPTPLRAFLSRYVIEGKSPRKLAVRLAELHSESGTAGEKLNRIRAISNNDPLPRLIRDVFVEEFGKTQDIGEMIATVKTFRNEPIDVDIKGMLKHVDQLSDENLHDLLGATQPSAEEEVGGRIFIEVIRTCSLSKLASAVDHSYRSIVIRLRPEIASVATFWPNDDVERAELIEAAEAAFLNVSDGVQIFGKGIGPRTAIALLKRSDQFTPSDAKLFLAADNREVVEAVATWIVQAPYRLAVAADAAELLPHWSLDALFHALILSATPVSDAANWIRIIFIATNGKDAPLSCASLILGYICAIAIDGEESLSLAQKIYDPLQQAVRQFRLSDVETDYLRRNLLSSSWYLRDAISQSAVRKWPVSRKDAGALFISSVGRHIDDLVEGILSIQGISALEDALTSTRLPLETQHRVQRLISGAKKRSRRSWWWE